MGIGQKRNERVGTAKGNLALESKWVEFFFLLGFLRFGACCSGIFLVPKQEYMFGVEVGLRRNGITSFWVSLSNTLSVGKKR